MPLYRYNNKLLVRDGAIAKHEQCCCRCPSCPACIECSNFSPTWKFAIEGAMNTQLCDDVDTISGVWYDLAYIDCCGEGTLNTCRPGPETVVVCFVQDESGNWLLRATVDGDSSGVSDGLGGPWGAVWELNLGPDRVECNKIHSLSFVSQTADNTPYDFSTSTFLVDIFFPQE